MGRHPEDEFAHQVVAFLQFVVGVESVVLAQQVVDEISGPEHMLGRTIGEDDVLNFEFDKLVVELQWVAIDVSLVAKFPEVLYCDVEFLGADCRHREVGHVVAHRTVLERRNVVFGAKNPLLHRFGGFLLGGEPFDRFQFVKGGGPLADVSEGVAKLRVDVDGLVLGRVGERLAVGTLRPTGLIGVDFAVTVRADVDCLSCATAVRTARPKGSSPTVRTVTSAHLNLDVAFCAFDGIAVLGSVADRALAATGFADGKERVDSGREFPLLGFLRTPHPVPDASGGTLADGEGCDFVDSFDCVVPLVVGSGAFGEVRGVPIAVKVSRKAKRSDERSPVRDDQRLLVLCVGDEQSL